jgi:hypothetical protein
MMITMVVAVVVDEASVNQGRCWKIARSVACTSDPQVQHAVRLVLTRTRCDRFSEMPNLRWRSCSTVREVVKMSRKTEQL